MTAANSGPAYFGRGVPSGVLLDSNLLLLLTVGTYDPQLILTFKRVSGYTIDDFKILEHFASGFREVLVTPHVLTEVSNLANSLPYHLKADWFAHFALHLAGIEERHLRAEHLTSMPEFALFGLTDAALTLMAGTVLLVTGDERLCSHLQRRKLLAVSFAEVRAMHYQE